MGNGESMSETTYIPYETIYRWILTPSNHDMTDTEQTLFLYYMTFEKECFKSLKSLMEDLKMSKNKIIAARKGLEQKGWILVRMSGEVGSQKIHVRVNQNKVAQLSKKHTVSKQPAPCSVSEPPPVPKREAPLFQNGKPPVPKKASSEDYLSEDYLRESVAQPESVPALSIDDQVDNYPPHLRHELVNTEYSRLKQGNPKLINAIMGTVSNRTSREFKLNVLRFAEKFPDATGEDVIAWHSSEWLSTWQYKREPRTQPEMGTLLLAYVQPKTEQENSAIDMVRLFLTKKLQPSEVPFWTIEAYKASKIKRNGLIESELNYAVQEVMKYAPAITAAA